MQQYMTPHIRQPCLWTHFYICHCVMLHIDWEKHPRLIYICNNAIYILSMYRTPSIPLTQQTKFPSAEDVSHQPQGKNGRKNQSMSAEKAHKKKSRIPSLSSPFRLRRADRRASDTPKSAARNRASSHTLSPPPSDLELSTQSLNRAKAYIVTWAAASVTDHVSVFVRPSIIRLSVRPFVTRPLVCLPHSSLTPLCLLRFYLYHTAVSKINPKTSNFIYIAPLVHLVSKCVVECLWVHLNFIF